LEVIWCLVFGIWCFERRHLQKENKAEDQWDSRSSSLQIFESVERSPSPWPSPPGEGTGTVASARTSQPSPLRAQHLETSKIQDPSFREDPMFN
jgi:hypothetical protein